MEFLEITEKEYEQYWQKHPLKTFLSAVEIGKLREKKSWKTYYVGVKKENELIGAAMLLSHKRKFGKYEFYSPRGFLLDYKDKELLKFFTREVSSFIKKKNGYILRIDPYVINKERDKDGKVKVDGIDNKKIIESLKEFGYRKVPTKNKEQVSWMFSLDLEGKTEEDILKDMKPNTRNIIRKTEKLGIKIKELTFDELPKFNNILKETGKRRGFKPREKEYYEEMYKLFHPKNEVKYYISELNINDYVEKLSKEKEEKTKKLSNQSNIKRSKTKSDELKKDIEVLTKKIIDAENIRKKTNSDIITLSGSMFMLIHPEIIYLSSGNYEEYLKFNSQYLLQWELIKYGIKNGFKKHNFYGIPENISEKPDNYGIYEFKKGFNGYVEELIGEYELPLSIYYYLFKLLHKLKEVKYALHL